MSNTLEVSQEDASEFDESYRSLCVTALLAIIAGLASPLVLFGGLFLVVPCTAIALGVTSLRQIAGSDGFLSGRPLALAGLALGVTSLAATYTHQQTYRYLLQQQATPVAQQWLDEVVQGNPQKTYLLTLSGAKRGAMAEHFASPEHQGHQEEPGTAPTPSPSPNANDPDAGFRFFKDTPAIADLFGDDPPTSYRLLSHGPTDLLTRRQVAVSQRFELTLQSGKKRVLNVVLQGDIANGGRVDWRVADFVPAGPDA